MEEWKSIEGYEGLYEVSNFGYVRSIERVIKASRGEGTRIMQAKTLTRIIDPSNGYRRISLSKLGVVKKKYIHRLVALHFIPNPSNKKEVNHKDFDRTNPHIDNLEWVTSSENTRHLVESGRLTPPTKAVFGIHIVTGERIDFSSIAAAKVAGFGNVNKSIRGSAAHCKQYKWHYRE